ncbi:MAG: prepilin-type N-terminal cleavage/methylation domain-containing protein [Gammaproteobacteria bacterium]
MNGKTRNHGFTLIEVIIAMTLLAVMMLLLFAGMRISIRNWDAGVNKMEEVGRMAAVRHFFNRQLRIVRPLQDNFSEEEPVFSFQGERQSLRFVASSPESAGRYGQQSFTVFLKKTEPGNRILVASMIPFYPSAEGEEWKPEEVTILEHIDRFELFYYGALEAEEEQGWHDEWMSDHLPGLIKVVVAVEGKEPWPEIIAATRISQVAATGRRQQVDADEIED